MMTRPALFPSSRSRATRFAVVGVAAALALGTAAPAFADEQPDIETEQTEEDDLTKGEKRLAKLLEGRVAGEPVDCIRAVPTQRMTTIDKTAYVYGRGNTIYVQRTRQPNQIDDRDTLITRRFGGGTQLCRVDIATTIDPVTGIFTGAVFFEDFVPYTRVKDDAKNSR
ncbi:MAG: hypothetical protein WBA51_00115 [Erythrobacter sp.]